MAEQYAIVWLYHHVFNPSFTHRHTVSHFSNVAIINLFVWTSLFIFGNLLDEFLETELLSRRLHLF